MLQTGKSSQKQLSKHPYTAEQSKLPSSSRKSLMNSSLTKLTLSGQTSKQQQSGSRSRLDDLSEQNKVLELTCPQTQVIQSIAAQGSSQKHIKSTNNVLLCSPAYNGGSFTQKQKQSKTPYQELNPRKQINNSQLTPNSSKKAPRPLKTQTSKKIVSRAGSTTVINDQKNSRGSAKTEKREAIDLACIKDKSKQGVQRSLSRQTLQQRLEKQIISNSTLNFGIDSLELIHEQSADQTTEQLYYGEDDGLKLDTTNEASSLDKQNNIPTEIYSNSITVFPQNNSRYAIRKPYLNAVIPRSPNDKFTKSMKVYNAELSLSNSSSPTNKKQKQSKLRQSDDELKIRSDSELSYEETWNQEINYNLDQDLMQQTNPSPKQTQKKVPYDKGYGSTTAQLTVQYINNLNNAQNLTVNSSKNGSAINASNATTVLASANNSAYTQNAFPQLPQQMTQMSKPLQNKRAGLGNIAVEQADLSRQKLFQAHSPMLRQQPSTQQSMIQNPPGKKMLNTANKQQNMAFISRVQVSPINNNFALSRDNEAVPLTVSTSSSNLQNQKKPNQSAGNKLGSYLQSNGKNNTSSGNLQQPPQTQVLSAGQNTQKPSSRKSAAIFTPGSTPGSVVSVTKSKTLTLQTEQNEFSQVHEDDYSNLMRVLTITSVYDIHSPPFQLVIGSPAAKKERNLNLLIKNVQLDEPNQNVIQADSHRTRFLSGNKDLKTQMVQLLTFYVKESKISYKQGLNELLMPFLWFEHRRCQNDPTFKKAKSLSNLQSDVESNINLERVYLQLKNFIDRYLPNIFINDDFVALQSCMALLRLLFKYHAPNLYCFLEKHSITIEMYAIPWIITYFSTKMDSPELVLQLWNNVAGQDPLQDVSYIFFFAVSMLIDSQEEIMQVDEVSLPVVMAGLRISDQQKLQRLFDQVHTMQQNTPFSFSQLPELHMLMNKTSNENLLKFQNSLEHLHCLPLLPAELLFYCFPDECSCQNPSCANSLTYKRSLKGHLLPIECTSICPDICLRSFIQKSEHKTFLKSEAHKLEQLEYEDQPIGTFLDRLSPDNRTQHFKDFKGTFQDHARPNTRNQVLQMETESNLNCDMDHQESPIDLINETARMKHLNVDKFKQQEQLHMQLGSSEPQTPDDYDARSCKSDSIIKLQFKDFDYNNFSQADFCHNCLLKQKAQIKMDTTKQFNESFEDLTHDCLVNKIRFIAIDCRINSLKKECSLPNTLSIDLTSSTKREHLRQQVDRLSMYKETYHICLIGLSLPDVEQDDIQHTPKLKLTLKRKLSLKNKKGCSLKEFHEEALNLLVELFVSQGFQHVSTLPGGFAQIHEIATSYGFNMIDHDPTETRIMSPTNNLFKRCYHCKMANNFDIAPTPVNNDLNFLVSIKDQDNTDRLASKRLVVEQSQILEDDCSYYMGQIDQSLLLDGQFNSDSDEKEEPLHEELNQKPKVRGFDLGGGWDYIPFGLRQVYEAVRMVADRHNVEQVKPQEPTPQPVKRLNSEESAQESGRNIMKKQFQSLSPNKTEQKRVSNIFPMAAVPENKPAMIMGMRPIRLSDDVHQRDSSNKNKKFRDLSQGRANNRTTLNPTLTQNEKILNDYKNPSYQNQQHLQQQTQIKLLSKFPEYTHESHNESHPNEEKMAGSVKKNRPRINCELQQQEINQYWQKMQQEAIGYSNAQSSRTQNIRQISGETDRVFNNVFSNGSNSKAVISQTEKSSRQSNASSTAMSGKDASVFSQSHNDQLSLRQSESTRQSELLPLLPCKEESYLLNGLVSQFGMDQETYMRLTSERADSQVSFVFTAVRLSARKKSFQIKSQQCFNFQVPSKILITPFTVAILHKESDLINVQTQTRMQTEEIDSLDFEENDERLLISKTLTIKDIHSKNLPVQDFQNNERAKSFATLQSRFFMYDLIKITSRKSTTKIITFYFRIPKLKDYPVQELEKVDILSTLNNKPIPKYAFAFKRSEYEEVSMSFEFEQEEQAKNCISNVSSLYKKLKNTQKRHTKKTETTKAEDEINSVQVSLPSAKEEPRSRQIQQRLSQPIEKQIEKISQDNQNYNRNSQNPSQILQRLAGNTQSNPLFSGQSQAHSTPSQYSLHQKP